MKILLTGSSGMVGKNILECPKAKNFIFLKPNSIELNLLSYSNVYNYLNNEKPDLVIHAAGKVGGIQKNIAEPVSFLVENLDMARNIILASRDNGVKKIINLGSSCMYPRNAINPLREDFILEGKLEPTNEGYALAKIVSAKLCEYIQIQNSQFEYKTIIPCNLYGKYDKFSSEDSHMLPAVIKKLHNAKIQKINSVDIWGDGSARREFMYAGDLADFIFYAIENFEELPQNLNVGLGEDYSINEYYKIISEVVDYKGEFFYDLSKPVGMKQKLIDDTKLKKFGWKHSTKLIDGIKIVYEYYKNEILNEGI